MTELKATKLHVGKYFYTELMAQNYPYKTIREEFVMPFIEYLHGHWINKKFQT
jgi:hypothetical protein